MFEPGGFSVGRWWAVVVKEFIQIRRDRLTFAMVFGIPVAQLALFGYAIDSDPKHMPTAVLRADDGDFARGIVETLARSEYFAIADGVDSEAGAREALARGEIQFVVSIPPGFTAKLLRGERPVILVEADASDPAVSSAALAAVSRLPELTAAKELRGREEHYAPPLFETRIHRLYNPEGITRYHLIPGLMGVILTITMVQLTGLAITRERERGAMENLLALPFTALEVIAGKILPYIAIGMLQSALIIACARQVFGVPLLGGLAPALIAALLFVSVNLAVGITLSSLAANQLQAMQLSVFYFLPNLMLSGFVFPFRGMPGWARLVGECLPLTHFNRLIRGILLKGNDWPQLWPDVWPLLVFGMLVMAAAALSYRRTLD